MELGHTMLIVLSGFLGARTKVGPKFDPKLGATALAMKGFSPVTASYLSVIKARGCRVYRIIELLPIEQGGHATRVPRRRAESLDLALGSRVGNVELIACWTRHPHINDSPVATTKLQWTTRRDVCVVLEQGELDSVMIHLLVPT